MKSRRNLLYTALSTFTALTVTVSMIPVALAANTTKTASTTTSVTETVSIPASSATLTFSDSGITATGEADGVKIDGTELTIKAAGVYTITGDCAEGSIKVKKNVEGPIVLILEDLTLSSSTTAPLAINKMEDGGRDVTVYAVGSVTLTDQEDASTAETNEDYEGAAIKVKSGSNLTIAGTGTLNLNGGAEHGIKVGDDASLSIESGAVNITAVQDGINSNTDLSLAGGAITVSAGDDGIHSDAGLYLNGSDVVNTKSYEGLEGASIELNAGTGCITASDDGVNAADGTASGLTINGGYWWINAGGDGLDAGGDSNNDNGTIVMNGGTVEVFGAANNGNAALDAGRGITYNGGTLLAVGMSGMAEAPGGGSVLVFGGAGMGGMMGQMGGMNAQNGPQGGFGGMQGGGSAPATITTASVQNAAFGGRMGGMQQGGGQMNNAFGGQQNQQFGQNMQNDPLGQQNPMQQQGAGSVSISAGSTIAIKDGSGSTIYTATAVKNADSVVFASDSLTEGAEYTLCVDGTAVAAATAGSGAAGGMQQMQQPGQQMQQGQAPQQGQMNGQLPAQGDQSQQNAQAPQLGQNEQFGQQPRTNDQGQMGGMMQQVPAMGGMMQQGPQAGGQFGGQPQAGNPMGGMNGNFRMMR